MKTMSSVILLTAAISTASFLSFPNSAQAQEARQASSEKQAEAVITFRQSLLQLLASNMGPLGAMAKGDIPMNADVIGKNAGRINYLSAMMHDYFALDTSNYDIETAAKEKIWANQEDFSSKIDDLVEASANLQKIVENNQENNFRKGIGAVGASCKACHDEYKID